MPSITGQMILPIPSLAQVPPEYEQGNAACPGDVILHTSDGLVLCVEEEVLLASPILLKEFDSIPEAVREFPQGRRLRGTVEIPCLILLLLVQAIRGQPVVFDSIAVAEGCMVAVHKLAINEVFLQYHCSIPPLFQHRAISDDPIRFYILAWMTKQWEEVSLASRFTRSLYLSICFQDASQAGNLVAVQAICALALTRLENVYWMQVLVRSVPASAMVCEGCRADGRDVSAEVERLLGEVLEQPYPSWALLCDAGNWARVLVPGCRHRQCERAVPVYQFTEKEVATIRTNMMEIRETVLPNLLGSSAAEM